MTNFNSNYDDVDTDAVLNQFAVEFPGAFETLKPLMRGAREALLAQSIGRTEPEVAAALAKRTSSPEYLEAMFARGAMRRDLKGDEVEEVSADDKIHALWRRVQLLDEERADEIDELRRQIFDLSNRLYEVERRGPE
jgi:hypothetical protein